MKTLLEELLYGSKEKFNIDKDILDLVDKSILFKVDNVSEYFFSFHLNSNDGLNKLIQTLPNVAPPFKKFFMEFKSPKIIPLLDGSSQIDINNFNTIGLLFNCKEPNEFNYEVSQKLDETIKWVYSINIFIKENANSIPYSPIIEIIIPVNSEGTIPNYTYYTWPYRKGLSDDYLKIFDTVQKEYVGVCLLSLSFIHCKNVVVTNIDPIKKFHGKRNRYGPHIKFKTLSIEPMKKILRVEGKSESKGLSYALHICRGHFKTFEDKGLFGKHFGTFWWDDQVRGKVQNGIVEKDYSIKTEGIKNVS
jgi:hypothetical protein